MGPAKHRSPPTKKIQQGTVHAQNLRGRLAKAAHDLERSTILG